MPGLIGAEEDLRVIVIIDHLADKRGEEGGQVSTPFSCLMLASSGQSSGLSKALIKEFTAAADITTIVPGFLEDGLSAVSIAP